MSRPRRSGHRYRTERTKFYYWAKTTNQPCWRCGGKYGPIDYTTHQQPDSFELDHYHPLALYPHLAYEPSNFRATHSRCNRAKLQPSSTGDSQWTAANW